MFESEDTFWFEAYKDGDELVFKSNKGDYDTLKIVAVMHYEPKGECNAMVSNYDKEFVRIDYAMKKDTFDVETNWFVQHSAEPDKKALPILRFLNMEYNEWGGPPRTITGGQGGGIANEVFLFDSTNCVMTYGQKFGIVNFFWSRENGLIGYENNRGEKWALEKTIASGAIR